MTTNRLLPCPFCDANDAALSEPPVPWLVICGTCGAEGPYADKRKEAIAAWNTRTPPSEPSEALRRLLIRCKDELECIPPGPGDATLLDDITAALNQPEQEKEGTK